MKIKRFFRSFLLVFSFIFFGIGSTFFNYIIFPTAKFILKENSYINFSSDMIRILWTFFIKYLEFIRLIKINVKDLQSFKAIQNKVIVSTHPSFIDVVVLMSLIPKTTCFVKKSLTKNFILKNIVNSIFILNDVEVNELKLQTKKYLDLGFNIIIFPTGTRHRYNEHLKIKKGASLVAINAKKDIVPIKLKTSDDFLFVNVPFYQTGENIIEYSFEIKDTIKIDNYYDENEIVMKRNITKEIANALYN